MAEALGLDSLEGLLATMASGGPVSANENRRLIHGDGPDGLDGN